MESRRDIELVEEFETKEKHKVIQWQKERVWKSQFFFHVHRTSQFGVLFRHKLQGR